MKVGFLGDIYVGDIDGPAQVSRDLCDELETCDHVVANVEAPITDAYNPIEKTGPVMRQSGGPTASLLESLSVSIGSLANNHIGDHGESGIRDTLKMLERCGIQSCGAACSFEETYSAVRLEVDGVTASVLAAGENGFGCLSDEYSQSAGYAWMFHPAFYELIRIERQRSHFVIVVAHGGVEHMDRPLPQWRSVYRRMIDYGADAVVAHHPHLTQGIEYRDGRPIFYSIGNFYFNSARPQEHWYYSLVPILHLNVGHGVFFDLVYTHFSVGGEYRIKLDTSGWVRNRTAALSQELNADSIELYMDRVANDLARLWRSRFLPGLTRSVHAIDDLRSMARLIAIAGRALLGNDQWTRPLKLEAFCEIESHRWAIAEIMRNKQKRQNGWQQL